MSFQSIHGSQKIDKPSGLPLISKEYLFRSACRRTMLKLAFKGDMTYIGSIIPFFP